MPENPEPPQPENAKGETAKAAAGDTTSGDAKGKNGDEQSKRRMFGSVAFWALAVGLLILWAFGWYSGVCGRWVHLLPILALFAVIADLVTRGRRGDINPESGIAPKWDPDNPLTSLEKIRAYVIEEAAKSINWYWHAKRSKARPSYIIRFLAWVLAAVAGLLPILGGILTNDTLNKPLWPSLLLGIAAALFGLDKTFGYSSGWARYVLTATNIRKTLEEFRMDWAQLMAKAGTKPKDEDVAELIARATRFRIDVERLILQETKEWVTEFQTNTAQTEKEITTQLSALKEKVDKPGKPPEQPGPSDKPGVTPPKPDQPDQKKQP